MEDGGSGQGGWGKLGDVIGGRNRIPSVSPQRTDSDNLTDVELHTPTSNVNGVSDYQALEGGFAQQTPRADVLTIDLTDIRNQVEGEELHTATDLQSVSFRGPLRESSRYLPYRGSDKLDKREGRYKAYVYYDAYKLCSGQNSLEIEFVEMLPMEQVPRKKILTTMRRRQERKGSGTMVLLGSCLYIFQKGSREEEENVRAIFVLDNCEYREVSLQEEPRYALDIFPGGRRLDQWQFRVIMYNEQNRREWSLLLQKASPYYCRQLIEDKDTQIELAQSRIEDLIEQTKGIADHKTYLEERCETLDNELEQQKNDNLQYVQEMEEQLRLTQENCQSLEGQFHSAWIELDQKKTQLQSLAEERDKLLDEKFELQSYCQQLNQEFQTQGHRYEMELQNIKSQLNKAFETKEEYEAKIVSLNQELSELQGGQGRDSDLEQVKQDFAQQMQQVNDQLQNAHQQYEEIRKEKGDLISQLQIRDIKITDLEKQLERSYTPRAMKTKMNAFDAANDLEDDLLIMDDEDQGEPLSNNVHELQQQLRQAKEQLKRQQVKSEEQKTQLLQLEGKESAMDQYIDQFTKQRRQLEDENERLMREIEKLKSETHSPSKIDEDIARDPSNHLDFILNTAARIRMENDRLRTLLQQHGIQDSVDEYSFNKPFIPMLLTTTPEIDDGAMENVPAQLQDQQIRSQELPIQQLPIQQYATVHYRSQSARLHPQTSISPSPRMIRPRRIYTQVSGPRLGRVKGNTMTAIEVVPDAP